MSRQLIDKHQIRVQAGLSLNEAAVMDCIDDFIYTYSELVQGRVGWYNEPSDNIAQYLGLTSVTVRNCYKSLIGKGYLEEKPGGAKITPLRPTKKYKKLFEI